MEDKNLAERRPDPAKKVALLACVLLFLACLGVGGYVIVKRFAPSDRAQPPVVVVDMGKFERRTGTARPPTGRARPQKRMRTGVPPGPSTGRPSRTSIEALWALYN